LENEKKSNKKKSLQKQESQPQESHSSSAHDLVDDEKKSEFLHGFQPYSSNQYPFFFRFLKIGYFHPKFPLEP